MMSTQPIPTYSKRPGRLPYLVCCLHGGDKGIRTPDLLTASQALSQLSYIPELVGDAGNTW